jgi:hypothetical protein
MFFEKKTGRQQKHGITQERGLTPRESKRTRDRRGAGPEGLMRPDIKEESTGLTAPGRQFYGFIQKKRGRSLQIPSDGV